MAFRGWPQEAFEFYEELEANNDRDWWLAHKATYDTAVKAPMDELMAAAADEFGPMRLFRPNRDVRFSKDKSPYKTAAAAMTATDGAACYVQLSSEGLMVGGGQYHLASDQLTRFRDAIADDDTGTALGQICDDLRSDGYEIAAAETLKTAPRGWDKDHPRIDLARMKGMVVLTHLPRARWMSTAKALGRITDVWRDGEALFDWLDANVGPSTLPQGRR